ncbi:MAG: 3'-5' exonuclease, partial [Casimicrobiaceae bacterium]
AFLRVVNFPPRGIGARSLEQLQDAARTRGTSLWQAACEGAVKGRAGTALASFVGMLEGAREAVANLPLRETVEHMIEVSGLAAHYRAERDGDERLDNLAELVSAAESFTREADLAVDVPIADGGMASDGARDALSAFLAHAALEAGDTQEAEGRAALQLMTMHAAKGLEFHTVFVTGLEEGLFPHENSRNEDAGLEEERRLMYVAVTRARRRLYLTLAHTRMLHGQTRYNLPSRFIDELPRDLVQWLSPRRPHARFDRGSAERGTGTDDARFPASRDGRGTCGSPPRPHAPAVPGWRIGESVRHTKFGPGIIIDSEGHGSDARVQVNFRDVGVKWLALDYARLERISGV